ncbi:MATE family efflux transporter [Bifidobacterium sp.]|jgi:putative MATE family efflux protein|uniref:MATE family efflux transporter n=1 Tax=Bifidobacterium sp. TaxID=41200 RepID=UPI0025C26FB7|nr:MATE family efflux transporter [Bifidobacterium sp.]MCI1635001.1 MATE family efflux transporter [Bifidobacterium sp.]
MSDKREIRHSILSLAIPTFGQLIAEPTFILIDTAVVGHIGDASLAGLSIGSTILLTTVGLCVFLAYNTTSQVASLMGAGHKRQGIEAGVDGMWLALIIGLLASVLLFFFGGRLCELMGARGQVLIQAELYLQAIIFGLPGMLLVYAANGIFRGMRKVRITLIAAIAGAVVNTILELLFVLVFHWSIVGSGAATLIAQWFMGIMLTVPALIWARKFGASWKPRLEGIASSAGDGFPLFIRTLALRLSLVMTVVLATHMGEQVLAAYQAVNSTWNFALNMLDAIGIAGQALVATAIGARDREASRHMTREAARAGLLTGVAIGIVMVILGIIASPLFSPSANIQLLITVGMIVQAIFLPLAGWMWALDGILIGAEDYRFLAFSCTLTAAVYLLTLWGANAVPWPNDIWSTALLWSLISVVFIGIRAVCNGLRVRSNIWIDRAIDRM